MFKIVLTDVELLKNTIPIIAEIIDEGVFKVDQNGISLLAPDRTMVSVVDFRLPSTAFEKYKVDTDTSMGLNLANFVNVIKRIKGSDQVTLELAKDNTRLKVTVEGNGKRTFEIPLLDIKDEKPPIDQLNFTGRVEIESRVIEDGIADAEIVGDSVIFEATPEFFRIYSKGDVSSTELEMTKKDSAMLKLHATSNLRARYPLEYLKKMVKAAKLSKHAVLEFGNDYPMRLEFKEIDKAHLSFILAPRVEE
ncbi:MAG: proliferating cell nuclear antigen (pcna) [Candidatus Aenigmarchaeota archaeon]|nr:proliferating cell nuclear antigen (pcna) [Candidatus Aenigmarchaeota archaeon]